MIKGTLYVLLEAYIKKLLTKQEVIKLVNELIYSGFWISQDIYIKFLEE